MTITLRIALSIISILFLLFIIKSIKSKDLQLSFSVFWIFLVVIMLLAIVFPNAVYVLSNWIGFKLTSNMIFFITIMLSFYMIFNLTIKISKDNSRIRELIQEISILNKKISDLEKKD